MHVKDVSAQGTRNGVAVMGRMIVQSSRLQMAKNLYMPTYCLLTKSKIVRGDADMPQSPLIR